MHEEWAKGNGAASEADGEELVTTEPGEIRDPDREPDQALPRPGRRWIGLSLDVPEGSVFGLLGENGAGKTTTLQILLGLIARRRRQGRACWAWIRSASGLEIRRRVGYVPEQPALYDWMTVAEIGWFAAGFHPDARTGAAAFQTRYIELTEGFGLPPKRKIKPSPRGCGQGLSVAGPGVGPAAAWFSMSRPPGLDAMVRREFLESMVDLASTGRTVLLSSHQIAEVERVASHIAMLHQGKLILAEPLDELKAKTFLLAITFTSRDHPLAPPANLPVELIDARRCATPGPLAGPGPRPRGGRLGPDDSRRRVAPRRDPKP